MLAYYELGEVRRVRELAAGAPASPKALIECARGTLLLKRRAIGVDAPGVVAFGHRVLLGCLRAGVCVPPMLGTRDENNSMVQLDGRVYELFVYIQGGADPGTVQAAEGAGTLLAEMHRAMDGLMDQADICGPDAWPAPLESGVIDPTRADRARVDAEIAASVRGVLERASRHVSDSDRRLVHGDWHPGNLVFRADEPVAVCDFDNTRLGSREREVAQGLAQFSLTRGRPGEPAAAWPVHADLARLSAHWRGYLAGGGVADPTAVLGLMPGVLMEEALGSGRPETVWLVLRKAQWLEDHATVAVLEEGGLKEMGRVEDAGPRAGG